MGRSSLTSARDYFEEVIEPTYNQFFANVSSFQNT